MEEEEILHSANPTQILACQTICWRLCSLCPACLSLASQLCRSTALLCLSALFCSSQLQWSHDAFASDSNVYEFAVMLSTFSFGLFGTSSTSYVSSHLKLAMQCNAPPLSLPRARALHFLPLLFQRQPCSLHSTYAMLCYAMVSYGLAQCCTVLYCTRCGTLTTEV